MSITGCAWIVGKVKRWDSANKQYVAVPVHCNKMTDAGSHLCPKHKLFEAHGEKEGEEQQEASTYHEGR